MVLFLVLSILFTSYLVFAFKVFERLGINNFHVIVINYVICVITGSVFQSDIPDYKSYFQQDWIWIALILGTGFITFFNVMARVTKQEGITVTSVATKLSMVIPITVAVILYDEHLSILKIVGIVLSLLAVYLTSHRKDEEGHSLKMGGLLLLLVLFLGSGMNDSLAKHAQQGYLTNDTFDDFITTCFTVAAFIGLTALFYDVFVRKTKFYKRVLIAGIMLGVPNYFSIYFLLKALDYGDASFIYPVNNIGIVGFSTITARLFFKEQISVRNWIGLGIAVTAIVLMSVG